MGFSLTWHPSCADLPEALWRACFPPPCEGLFWYRALEAGTLEGQFQFLYGVLERDGAPIGIVPAFVFDVPLELVMPRAIARAVLAVARGPLRRLAFQRTLFIGNVAGEEGHVGLLPGLALGEAAAFIHARAREKADAAGAPMLVWKDFPDADLGALEAVRASGRAFRMPSYPGTRIDLVAGGHERFLAGMNAKRRRRIASKLRTGAAALALRSEVVRSPGDVQLDAMFALFEQTRARATTTFEHLTPGFFRTLAREPEVAFVMMRDESGRLRGFMLLLDLGTRIVNQFVGLDYAAGEDAYLHFRLFAAAYDFACGTRATVLQSGQTGYTAKLDLGHRLVALWNLAEHRGTLVNAVLRRGASGIGWDTLDPQLAEYLRAHPEARPAQGNGKLRDNLDGYDRLPQPQPQRRRQ